MSPLDWRQQRDRELEAELQSHLDMAAQDRVARGASPEDARAAARREFGNVGQVREVTREMWGWASLERFTRDLRFTMRQLARQPAFTAVAVLTLALGMGANSAIFTVLYRAVLRTLPVASPEALVHIVTDRGAGDINNNLSFAAFDALRARSDAFAGVAAHTPVPVAIGLPGLAERATAAAVSHGFFRVAGARMAIGRDFTAEEDVVGGPAAVVLSHALWQRRFAGRDDVVGAPVLLNRQPFTVVGVAGREFQGLVAGRAEELWVPLAAIARITSYGSLLTSPTTSWLDVFGRLAPGYTRQRAQSAMAVADAGQARAAGRADGATSRTLLLDGSRGLTFTVDGMSEPLRILMTVVGLVLLLACANVANLLLARAGPRQREVALRLALGASRGRLVRQFLTESAVLGVMGGAAGLLIARWGADVLLGYAPSSEGRLSIARGIDLDVLAFTAVVSLVTSVLFGLAPALRVSRPSLVPALKGQAPEWHERLFGLRGSLVVVQVAISLVLVSGAALFLRSIRNLNAVDVGYASGNVLLASVDLEQAGYDRARGAVFVSQLLDRLRSLPGATVVSAARVITPNPGGSRWDGMQMEGFAPPAGTMVSFDVNAVGPRYFEAMGVALAAGRGFTDQDRAGTPRVAVVNEAFALRYAAGRSPVGLHISTPDAPQNPPIEIVGVARDGKYRDLREQAQPNVYLPLLQSYASDFTLIVRTTREPRALAETLREELRALDPVLPLYDVRTLEETVAYASSRERMVATLSTAFGVLALALSAIGLFGIVSFGVAQRTRELGVRVALGARPSALMRMVVLRAGALVSLGLVVGLAAALALGRFTRSLLFGVAPTDPASVAVAAAVLAVVGVFAAWIPARRAARVNPVIALHSE